MPRVEVPVTVLNSSTGLPVSGAAVSMTHRVGGGPVTWWTAETGGTNSTLAAVTDSSGRVNAWVDRGAYNLSITGSGISPYVEAWDAVPSTPLVFRTFHAYAISGDIRLPTGDSDFIPPFFISLAPGQTANLVSVKHKLNAGTVVTYKLQKNAVDITGWTGLTAETTEETVSPTPATLASGDRIALVVTGITGTPKNLSVTLFIEHTL
jgi:hypothetical protein